MAKQQDECREYLESYGALMLESERLAMSARRLFDMATNIVSHMTGMPHGGGGDPEQVKVLLAQTTQDAEDRLAEAIRKRQDIESFVSGVPGPMNRRILELRYIDLLSWKQMIEYLSGAGIPYSERQVFNLHGRALNAAREQWRQRSTEFDNNRQEEARNEEYTEGSNRGVYAGGSAVRGALLHFAVLRRSMESVWDWVRHHWGYLLLHPRLPLDRMGAETASGSAERRAETCVKKERR